MVVLYGGPVLCPPLVSWLVHRGHCQLLCSLKNFCCAGGGVCDVFPYIFPLSTNSQILDVGLNYAVFSCWDGLSISPWNRFITTIKATSEYNWIKLDVVLSLHAENLSFSWQEQRTGNWIIGRRSESHHREFLKPEPVQSHLLVTGGKLCNGRLYREEWPSKYRLKLRVMSRSSLTYYIKLHWHDFLLYSAPH